MGGHASFYACTVHMKNSVGPVFLSIYLRQAETGIRYAYVSIYADGQ